MRWAPRTVCVTSAAVGLWSGGHTQSHGLPESCARARPCLSVERIRPLSGAGSPGTGPKEGAEGSIRMAVHHRRRGGLHPPWNPPPPPPRDALEGGTHPPPGMHWGGTPPDPPSAQPIPSCCLPDTQCQLQ